MRRPAWALATAVVIFLLCAPAASAAARTLHVGTLTLHRCGPHRGTDHGPGWCTKVPRLLDPRLKDGPQIGIQTQWLPASDGHAVGTIVAVEGGPGYPSTGSYDEYTGIFAPLLETHNLVLVDNRGTGGSGILICKRLQAYTGRTSGPAFATLVGAATPARSSSGTFASSCPTAAGCTPRTCTAPRTPSLTWPRSCVGSTPAR